MDERAQISKMAFTEYDFYIGLITENKPPESVATLRAYSVDYQKEMETELSIKPCKDILPSATI